MGQMSEQLKQILASGHLYDALADEMSKAKYSLAWRFYGTGYSLKTSLALIAAFGIALHGLHGIWGTWAFIAVFVTKYAYEQESD